MICQPLILRGLIEGEPSYSVAVPVAVGWLNANDRGRWFKHSGRIQQWRDAAGWAARAARVEGMDRAYLLAELRFADRRRRDIGNWYPTIKACVDGLIDVGVLPDDSDVHLLGPDLRMGPVTRLPQGQLVLHLWRLR